MSSAYVCHEENCPYIPKEKQCKHQPRWGHFSRNEKLQSKPATSKGNAPIETAALSYAFPLLTAAKHLA